jgi:CheY-like chemotaxis protein
MILPVQDILNARILVVDDTLANVQLFERLLAQCGYTNVSATLVPQEVCALHQRHRYDLILLDLVMPQMDGFHVMEALKAQGGDAWLPVIAVTAEPGHKVRALQAGAKDFIGKPFDQVEVKTRIHNMLEVRLLYKRLKQQSAELERTVVERTAELQDSEARYRALTELAVDWYWEQDELGGFMHVRGPVLEMLGLGSAGPTRDGGTDWAAGWDAAELAEVQTRVQTRQPFLDLTLSRVNADGSRQWFHVSGEPMFGHFCRLVGYRGIGVEVRANNDSRFLLQEASPYP